MQAVRDEGRAVQTKVHSEQRPEVRTSLRGIINSIAVKAQGVRVRDSVKSFLTFIKHLNYTYLCLLYGFMCSSPPL